jgi:hypothetical protein
MVYLYHSIIYNCWWLESSALKRSANILPLKLRNNALSRHSRPIGAGIHTKWALSRVWASKQLETRSLHREAANRSFLQPEAVNLSHEGNAYNSETVRNNPATADLKLHFVTGHCNSMWVMCPHSSSMAWMSYWSGKAHYEWSGVPLISEACLRAILDCHLSLLHTMGTQPRCWHMLHHSRLQKQSGGQCRVCTDWLNGPSIVTLSLIANRDNVPTWAN